MIALIETGSRWRAVFTAGAALLISLGANAGPREDIEDIARLIGEHYFDPQRAAGIADDLRRDAAAGAFDRFEDRSDLAMQVTQRLKPLDRHFDVIWNPRPATPASPGGPPPPSAFEASLRSTNYGFKRVERLPGNIGYLELSFEAHIDFERPDAPARQAADAALSLLRGADAVILDLRNNNGGAPSMVGYLVSAFVAPKSDVYNTFHSRQGKESERAGVEYPEPMLAVPLYVLTSPRTASAGESLAFTLQSCGRATVVGEASAGAANPGGIFTTTQGFKVFVSTGSPRNPINGRNWEGSGVPPDVAVPAVGALVRAQEVALEKLLAGPADAPQRTDRQWALEALRAAGHPVPVKSLKAYAGSYGPISIEALPGKLTFSRGRQTPVPLIPVAPDSFYIEGEPGRRIAFERRGTAVVGLELRGSFGDVRKLSRSEAPKPQGKN